MRSYLSHLECTACAHTFSAEEPHRTCPDCGKVLFARYDLEAARRSIDRADIDRRPATMWRFFEILPVRDPDKVVTLGEGGTPLFQATRLQQLLGVREVYIKDEGLNPTGTFKARGMAAAVSRTRELGKTRFSVPSAGNAAGALAAYAARGGLAAYVFMPRDAPAANVLECRVCGATVEMVEGLIGDAGRAAKERSARDDLFDLSTLQEPYRAEGKKTMGIEIAQQLGWRVPDVIVYPTGGGTGIVGIWKVLAEIEALGWIDSRRPRIVAVQAEGCAPIVQAVQQRARQVDPWPDPHTAAAGLRVPAPFADYLILNAIYESGGTAVAVTDQEMLDAVREMASYEGIFAAPEGAATLAGYKRLLQSGAITPEESVVLLNTGSGYKYLDVLAEA